MWFNYRQEPGIAETFLKVRRNFWQKTYQINCKVRKKKAKERKGKFCFLLAAFAPALRALCG
jgi:hypothetical protein